DPYGCGRGFEEMTACREAGVECVVIPGVSSAFAAPAAAGIPITDRRLVRSVGMIAGRPADEGESADARYKSLAGMDAVIILMGRSNLRQIADSLMAAGRAADTPVACIERATTPEKRVTVATLGSIADVADRENIQSPMVAVVGEVAALAIDSRSKPAIAMSASARD
ncbi:MAG: uroporphyrinogen-III C-methyltransferase, partial [Planctomycetes bacterium]|nr:uroporphyrinogen-III C-methyltransferase [Planctomycetota bacterium]